MTPTREQLELAAKAAGIVIHHWISNEPCVIISEPNAKYEQYKRWLPVTDKSDSFDLMVACEIEPMFHSNGVSALSGGDIATQPFFYADHNNDKRLATMTAVFLCAVEIGRAM
jgi:hypothetical protein